MDENKKPGSLKEQACAYIRKQILSGVFAPGSIISENQIIEHLNMSRTPVREALNRLEQEKLVEILPKRGVLVSQITLKQVMEVYQVREAIEPYGLKMYGHHLKEERLREFYRLFANDQDPADPAVQDLDNAFHQYLVSAYRNSYIQTLMDSIRGQNERIRRMSGESAACYARSNQEHLEILDYLLDGEFGQAAGSLRTHITNSKERIIGVLSNAY